MKNNSIYKLVEQARERAIEERLGEYAAACGVQLGEGEGATSREDALNSLASTEEMLLGQMTGRTSDGREVVDLPEISIKEALNTSDVSIVFPRVISTILQEPKEPNLFLTNQVAETIKLADNAPLTIEFPLVDALTATEMAEGQEYATATMSFQQHMISMRIKKIGIAAALNREVISQSMWPLLSLHIKMMSAAIDRKVENLLFQAMANTCTTFFDNEDANKHTTGKAVSGTVLVDNGSFSYNDLVKMCGVMIGNRYEPSHFLAHPLSWAIFAQDPIMRAQFYHGGQMGAGMWTRMPDFDQSANFPFGISYVPYYALTYEESNTLTGTLSAFGASLTSDLYLIDSKNSLFLATRGGTEMDQMENWFRDSSMVKARKYVGISAKHGGKAMIKAASVRIVKNEEAIFNIRTIAA